MKRLLLILLLLTAHHVSFAQVNVSGKVLDLQNAPISNVIVKAVNGNKTMTFATTTLGVSISFS